MAFTIPTEVDAFNADQAEIDKVDIDILATAFNGQGVLDGCEVTAQSPAAMDLDVSAGSVLVSNIPVEVTAGTVTIGAADPTDPRFDLVVVDSSGTKQVRAGIAAADPVFPTPAAGDTVLAAIYVPATDTAIEANQIVDKRVVTKGPIIVRKTADETVNNSTALQDDDHLKWFMNANETWAFLMVLWFDAASDIPDAKLKLAGPTGVAFRAGVLGLATTVTSINGDITNEVIDENSSEVARGLDNAFPVGVWIDGTVVNGGTKGEMKLQWAQNTAHASDVDLKAESYIIAWKL